MKHKELFRLYNLRNLKQNKWSMGFLALSVFIAMTVSLVLPQIKVAKQEYIDRVMEQSSPADLVVTEPFRSEPFRNAIETYKSEGVSAYEVGSSPVYLDFESNKFMIYLLSGYENLSDGEVVISEGMANSHRLKVGDTINVTGLKDEQDELTITGIEHLAIDVGSDAQVAGYIKTGDQVEASYPAEAGMLFLSGRSGEQLKEELAAVEPGYTYKTIEDRRTDLFMDLEKQIAALNLISTVGYLLAIAVLISGITILIVKSKKELATLILVSITLKDITKAMKKQLNIVIFAPLLAAVVASVPLAASMLAAEGIAVTYTAQYGLTLLAFVGFNVCVFLLYRNIALKSIGSLDALAIVKGGEGMPRRNRRRNLGIFLSLPIVLSVYAVLLGSETSMSGNFAILFLLGAIFAGLWILIEGISRLPFWKYHRSTLYAFKEIRKNKFIFVVGILNLTMMLWFILIGFGLGNTLKESVDAGYEKSLPYNYLVKTENEAVLTETLGRSSDIESYSEFRYIDGTIEQSEIVDKQIRINEVVPDAYTAKFETVSGEGVLDGNTSEVVIADAYSRTYGIGIGDRINVATTEGTLSYRVKGTYDSVGINNDWVLKRSEGAFDQTIYLVKSSDDQFLSDVQDSYIVSMNVIGDYLLAQMNAFLISFRYICFLFIIAAVVFNLNLLSLMNDLNRKEHAVIRTLMIGKRILLKESIIRSTISLLCSLVMSLILFSVLVAVAVSALSKGDVVIEGKLYLATILMSVVFVFGGNLLLRRNSARDTELIRE